MSIAKRVTFIAKPGCEAQLKSILCAMIAPSKAEPGLLFYEITQYRGNPRKFMAIEEWQDEAVLEGHKQTEHYKVYKNNYETYCERKYTDELEVLY
ncbi:MAG: antibiotic biosynthesis monooxygenase [Campylobacterales bacterium]|nr:antibiotic biosynthesis monooxygenase [Campylobacterales bacterium]